jgi:hypothetical protein
MSEGRHKVHGRNAGKGSTARPVDRKKFGPSIERIFGKKKFNGRFIK